MNSFSIALNALLPVFIMIALGFGAKKAGFIKEKDVPTINRVGYRVFMPFMCFYNIYTSDLSDAVRPELMAFAVGMVAFSYLISLLYGIFFVKERNRKGVVVQGLFRSNYLILGIPFAEGLTGGKGLGVVSVLAAVVVPMFNILAVITLESYNGTKPDIKKLLLGIVKNPLIVGSVIGIVFLVLGWKLPKPVESAVGSMAKVASPLLLFLLGAFFRLGAFKTHLKDLAVTVIGRLVVIPAIALPTAMLLGFRGPEFVALLAMFGSSTAANSFTMAAEMGGDASLAGDIVVMTSALSAFTLFFWSVLFKELGLY